MLESLIVATNAVVPFLFYLLFGYVAKRFHLVDDVFLKSLTGAVFKLFFPFTMFCNIYRSQISMMPSPKLLMVCILGILAMQGALILIVPRIIKENSRRGVFVQAAFRSNLVLFGIPLTQTLFGNERSVVAAMLIAVMVPMYNMTSIIILEMFNGEGHTSVLSLVKKILRNPLIMGCIAGIAFLLLGLDLPQCIATPVNAISNLTTPLALFALGGTLRFAAISKNARILTAGLLIKLILAPLFFLLLGYAIGLRSVELFLLVAVFATPVASSSYPMAANMGGDGELAGQFVFLSTSLCVPTLFLFIFFMQQFGLIV